MRIKYFVAVAVLLTAVLSFGGATPVSATTIAELQAQIALLQAQLVALQAQQSSTATAWCYTFTTNLGFAQSGTDNVTQLHTALDKESISYIITI